MKREDIEKAARKQLKGIVPCEWNQQPFIDIFVDAAKWRIESVWHDAGEKPQDDKLILISSSYGCIIGYHRETGRMWEGYYYHDDYKDEYISITWDVYRWAYIDDLLPNKED